MTTVRLQEVAVRILGFGTYDTSTHPRIGIILDGLRAHGDEVVEANAPLGFGTADRVGMIRQPWLSYRLLLRLLARWASIVRRARVARREGRFDAIVVGYLGHFDVVLARLLFPRQTIVLDLLVFAADTARDRGVEGALTLKLLTLLDELAIRCADVVVVDTAEAVGLMSPGARHKAVVVGVGAPTAWFTAGDKPRRSDPAAPLRVVFFGLFTPLQGAPVIGEALGQLADRPDIHMTMIGAGQDSAASRLAAASSRHVSWLDWLESDALACLVADHDVCLGIFGTTAKAFRVVPNKVCQGAAAGCAIITSDTAPQQRALGDAALFVPPGDAGSLAEALRQLALDRSRVSSLRAAARRRSALEFTGSAIVRPLRLRLAPDAREWVSTGEPS